MQQAAAMMAAPVAAQGAPDAWAAYFPGEEYNAEDRRALLIEELVAKLASEQGRRLLQKVQSFQDGYVLPLDCDAMVACCDSEDLAAALELQPAEGLACIAAAAHEVLFGKHKQLMAHVLGHNQQSAPITVRLSNYAASKLHIRQLKSSSIGKLGTIQGTVVRMSHIRPLIVRMDFACKCGEVMTCDLPDGKYAPPTKCAAEGCRSRTFIPDRSSARCIDWQKVRLQELVGADQQQQGRVPRTVEVELKEDLTGSCVVGDVLTVLGLVKVLQAGDAGGGKQGKNAAKQPLFLVYLDAISITKHSKAARSQEEQPAEGSVAAMLLEQQQGQQEGQGDGRQLAKQLSSAPPNMPGFSVRDLQFVLTFTEKCEGQQLKALVHALCPSIYGHELVKAGLLLALFGGVRKNGGSRNKVPIRGDIHVLLVGDPGLGKSQLLQAAAAASPRGLYVCGSTSRGAGLTVSVVKDPVSGDFMFEAGAVVLADRGVCCVDEFDKMGHEHQALLEAMEQQEISVSKAGLVASLPARTAILGAANPAGGRYDRGRTMADNLKMSAAMLSRFDLAFVLLDRADEALDQALSEHVMALHSGLSERAAAARQRILESHRSATSSQGTPATPLHTPSMHGQATGTAAGAGGSGTQGTLAERLKMGPDATGAETSPLPVQLLRTYINYARTYVFPVLSDEAKSTLQAFYLQLRAECGPYDGGPPVTARQLESLVRLCEARARADLREVITRQDAEDVIEIMREALFDTCCADGSAGLGLVDFRKAPGTRGGKAAEGARFFAAIKRAAEREGRAIFTSGELKALARELQVAQDGDTLIASLNEAGELLKHGPGEWRVRGVEMRSVSADGGSQLPGPTGSNTRHTRGADAMRGSQQQTVSTSSQQQRPQHQQLHQQPQQRRPAVGHAFQQQQQRQQQQGQHQQQQEQRQQQAPVGRSGQLPGGGRSDFSPFM